MEEVLFAQSLDLLVQPIQNGGVALAHSGSNGVLTAQRGNADRVTRVLLCKCNDLGVIVGPCHAVAVLQCILGRCIGIVLLQRNVGVLLSQVGLGGGAGNDDHLVVNVPVVQSGDNVAVRRNDTQSHVHVRQSKVHFLCALRGHGEVCQDHIRLAGLQVLDTVGSLGRNKVDLYAQILAQTACKADIIALIFAVLVHIAERVLIGEHADVDGAGLLDLIQRAVDHAAAGCCAARCCSCGGSRRRAAACGQNGSSGHCAQTQQEGTTRNFRLFHSGFSFTKSFPLAAKHPQSLS